MPRYIDADALIADIKATIDGSGCVNHEGEILDCIEYAATADVVPAVRGEWLHGCTAGMGTEFCFCSECGEDALKDKGGYTEFSRHCPSCGADMRRESEVRE